MARNTQTEFVVVTKQGDRERRVVVRGTGILNKGMAEKHYKTLQGKGHVHAGDVVDVEERPRSSAKRPAVLDAAVTGGVTLHKPGAEGEDVV